VARGKAAGLYIEQKIIRTGKIDDLTRDELERRMKKVLDDNELIINGDAKEVKNTNSTSSSLQPKKLESLSDPQK